MFSTGGVRAAQLICAIRAVSGSVAQQAGGQTAGGMGHSAWEGAEGTEAGLVLSGSVITVAFICGIATFVLTVAHPGTGKTLPISTQEFI